MPAIEIEGRALFYELSGPGAAPVVTFSNSIGTNHAIWDEAVAALRGRYRCLRYDTRGHGRSALPPGPKGIDDLAGDLRALLDALGIERTHLVGTSLGGMIAMSLAASDPARIGRLVVIASSAHLPPPDEWRARANLVRREGMGAYVDKAIGRWFTVDFSDSATARRVRRQFLEQAPDGYAACCEAIGAMDLRPRLAAIAAPTLIIAGADDVATPVAMSDEIRSAIPDAEMVIVPRAAHLLAVERPDVVNAYLLAFLDRDTRSTTGAHTAAGHANRKAVLGADHVNRAVANAGSFGAAWQDFITRYAWGDVWGDPSLPWKTRSLLTLAITTALHREDEFKLHLRPALRNGVSLDELRALLMQCAVYAGVPAANAAFHWTREKLGEDLGSVPAAEPGRSEN